MNCKKEIGSRMKVIIGLLRNVLGGSLVELQLISLPLAAPPSLHLKGFVLEVLSSDGVDNMIAFA